MNNFGNGKNNGKIDANELIKKVSEVNAHGDANEKDINDFINKNLSETHAKAVREILSDEEKTKALLNSDAAKTVFKKFFGGNGNG